MDSTAAGAGILMLLVVVAGLIFLVVLFAAPIKLYSIHREIQQTNALLNHQAGLLAKIEDLNRREVGLLAALVNPVKLDKGGTTST